LLVVSGKEVASRERENIKSKTDNRILAFFYQYHCAMVQRYGELGNDIDVIVAGR
jgi:hypothetical protein